MGIKDDHRADVESLARPLAKALKTHLEAQRKKVQRAKVDSATETAALRQTLLPHTTKAVQKGAARVAGVAGTGTPSPTTNLAGAWAWKAAHQINTTTQGQLDDLTTGPTGTTRTPTDVFDSRLALVGAMAAGIVSNCINSGASNYAKTLPATSAVTKTWTVVDSNPCATCSSVDGETVPATQTFSNGAPHGPIHDGCMCTVTFAPASTARSVRMSYDEEVRAKYSADDLKDMLAKGQAMKNATGDPSYPINDKEDLGKAIHAVGRGGADHDAIRKHILARAKALGLSATIPDNWNADGSLKTTKSADPDGDARADTTKVSCKTCTGSGKIREGHVTCPDCKGTGEVLPTVAKGTAATASNTARRQPRRQRRSLERLPEFRTFRTQFERRVEQTGSEVVLTGYPIRYGTGYDVRDMLGSFRETMHAGVANSAMEARDFDCRFLENHDGRPHGRTTNGTLVLTDTPRGLRSEVHLDGRRQDSNDLACAVERGDVTQMSCGFVVGTDEWSFGDDGVEQRDVFSFDELFDVSAVTYPASPTTSIELAQRMLSHAATESRERIRRLWDVATSVRSGKPLSQHDGEELRAAAEALYAVRLAPVPEVLDAYRHVTERVLGVLRVGKVLSADNESDIDEALSALHAADEIDIPGITKSLETIDKALDAGQAALSRVLRRANPDPGPNDKNPTLVPSTSPTSDKDARARQRAELDLARVRSLLAA